jgi:F420-dependent oxidoreductase-like protein
MSKLELAIMIEGQAGLNWERWKRLAAAAEDLGFSALNRSDHFTTPSGPLQDALELWASFTYLATATSRIKFGALVSPVTWRNPVIAAWSASAIDDLSGGRFHLGLGAGWQDREHRNYNFPLAATLDERFARLQEALEVVTHLFNSDEPFDLDGTYFPIREGLLLPRPARKGGPPIVVGGNGPLRTLPLAAKYAAEWNGVYLQPDQFRDRVRRLEELLAAEGRDPATVGRTLMHRAVIGKTEQAALAKLEGADIAALKGRGVMIGDPAQVAEGLHALAEAGVQRVDLQWLDMDDMDGLELISTQVMPQLG